MSTTAHSSILAAVVALLRAAPSLAGVQVERSRERALGETVNRAIVVRRAGSDAAPVQMAGLGTDWTTQIRVDCYARTDDGSAPDEACDELLLLAHAAIAAAEPTLGGLVMSIEPSRLGWDTEEFDDAIGCATAIYAVRHLTKPQTLEPSPQ